MFESCVYSIVDSYVPNFLPDKLKSLKYLSAIEFNKSIETEKYADLILEKIPKSFFSYLVQADIYNYYSTSYKHRKSDYQQTLPASIQLLRHWPHEVFALRELVPYLPPLNHPQDESKYSSIIWQICCTLQNFYGSLVTGFLYYILMSKWDNFERSRLKEIDFSANFGYSLNIPLKTDGKIKVLNPSTILQILNSRASAQSHEILKLKQIKLILDVALRTTDSLKAMEDITKLNKQDPGIDFIIHYNRVELYKNPESCEDFIQTLIDHHTQNIQLFPANLDLDGYNNILQKVCSSLPNLRSVCLNTCKESFPSINPLTSLSNLEHLHLHNINIREQMPLICNLGRPLTYLAMNNCDIEASDLISLGNSHHMKSLKQFSVGGSTFHNRNGTTSALLDVLRNLTEVKVLEIRQCNVALWPLTELKKLIDTLINLRQLTILDLTNYIVDMGPFFTAETLMSQITRIVASPSLNHINLDTPENISHSKSQCKEFQIEFLKKINYYRNNGSLKIAVGLDHVSIFTEYKIYT